MASTISAGTTSGNAIAIAGDTSGALALQTNNGTTAVTIDTEQRVAFVAGTAALPAITTTGDTNTGIFFSAADTIDFAKGGVACGQFDSSSNFKFNSGYGSVATAYGCRAWVNFNGQGTVAIRASANVSSITDNGTGDYTVNFTTAMPDINYTTVAQTASDSGTALIVNINSNNVNNTAPTTSATRMITFTRGAGSLTDSPYVNVAILR